jgi:RNA polymerase sigma factor (sigma-70 family)
MIDPSLWRHWIARAKAGDTLAFEHILETHAGLVLRLAQRFLLNDADAHDAAQEVFLKLHRSLSRFDEERELLPWLYRVTANACRDVRRRRGRLSAVESMPEMVDPDPTPEDVHRTTSVGVFSTKLSLRSVLENAKRSSSAIWKD